MSDELGRRRQEREDRLDDMFVKVAKDVLGPRASRAVRVGLEAQRAGLTPDEAEEVAVRWLREHPRTEFGEEPQREA